MPLDQAGVDRKLCPRHSSAIERIDVIRIGPQLLLFQFFGASYQALDPILDGRIGRPRRPSNKAIVGVIPGIHRPSVV